MFAPYPKEIQNLIDKIAKRYKNKKIIVYGAGSFSQAIFENCDLSKINIVGIVDKKFESQQNTSFYGFECFSPTVLKNSDFDLVLICNKDFLYFKAIVKNILKNTKNSRVKILSVFKQSLYQKVKAKIELYKYKKEAQKRKLYLEKIKQNIVKTAKSCGPGLFVGGESFVTSNTILAEHVSFNGMRIMGNGKVSIGKYFHSGIECLIITQNHNYDNGQYIPYDSTYVYKDIEIGDFVWLGSRVMILPGTKIGEGAIIQGGSVVHGEIPPFAVAGGNPAKVFKYRDIEHFKKLKAEGKFY